MKTRNILDIEQSYEQNSVDIGGGFVMRKQTRRFDRHLPVPVPVPVQVLQCINKVWKYCAKMKIESNQ
jgi:hypothetical protein